MAHAPSAEPSPPFRVTRRERRRRTGRDMKRSIEPAATAVYSAGADAEPLAGNNDDPVAGGLALDAHRPGSWPRQWRAGDPGAAQPGAVGGWGSSQASAPASAGSRAGNVRGRRELSRRPSIPLRRVRPAMFRPTASEPRTGPRPRLPATRPEYLPQLDKLVSEGMVIIDPVEGIRYVGRPARRQREPGTTGR